MGIYLEQVNHVVIEARKLTFVIVEGRIFLITVHVCMKNIRESSGNAVSTCVSTREKKTSENCLICSTMPGLTDASELRIKFS